jgi:hypothetical protein
VDSVGPRCRQYSERSWDCMSGAMLTGNEARRRIECANV